MKNCTKLLPLITLSAGLVANTAQADAGQFYIAPGVQWMEFDDSTNLKNDTGYFFGLGYDFTDRLSAEISVFDIDPETPGTGVDADMDNWKIDWLYDLNGGDRRVNFFGVSGFGNTNFHGNDTVWDLGGGVNVKLTDQLSWRTAIRNYMFFGRDHEDSDYGVDSALVYRFGGAKRAPARTTAPVAQAAAPEADADQDGVPDSRDKCPDTPRTYAVDADGCPIPVEEVARIELAVTFDFDRSVVKPEFFAEIERVAQFMRQYPDVVIELEGHTDSTGTDEYNLGLSQRRADAVRQVLLDRFNVQASRITARGFGESRPVASNNTPAGRAQNRRVISVAIKTLQNYRPR